MYNETGKLYTWHDNDHFVGILFCVYECECAAGGYLIQVLPFASDACIDQLEKNIQGLPHVTKLLTDGMTPDQIALRLLDGLEPNLLDEATVSYHCDCSQERTERVLVSLGKQELEQMAADGEDITVTCHFCHKQYTFTPDELRKLAKKS